MAFVFSWFFLKSYLGILSGNKPGFYDKAVNKDFLNLSNCAAKMGDNDDGKNIEQKQWTINQRNSRIIIRNTLEGIMPLEFTLFGTI